MRLTIQKRIPQPIILKAMQMIEQVNNKEIRAKRLNIKGNGWYSLAIGIRYRVIIKSYTEDRKVYVAMLCSHETYSKEINKKV